MRGSLLEKLWQSPLPQKLMQSQPGQKTLARYGPLIEELQAALSPRYAPDERIAHHAAELREQGWTRIPANVSPALCDEVARDFHDYCASAVEATQFRDSDGLHTRLSNLHLVSKAAQQVALSKAVLNLLDHLFATRTVIVSSLAFEKGTQQGIHRDSPFFHTNPAGRFFGVWTALEDIHPDAGPLIYYTGGQKVVVDRLEAARRHPDNNHDAMFEDYMAQVIAQCQEQGLPLDTARMHKGDTLIWHPQLPHGGSPILAPGKTRKSIVFHYMPEWTPIAGLSSFFSPTGPSSLPTYRPIGTRLMIDQGAPMFLHNY